MTQSKVVSSLLDVTFLDPLFVQVLYELLALHPVDKWAGVSAVAKKCSACEVQSASCRKRRQVVTFKSPAVLLKVTCLCAA